jgi:hypothetical protein
MYLDAMLPCLLLSDLVLMVADARFPSSRLFNLFDKIRCLFCFFILNAVGILVVLLLVVVVVVVAVGLAAPIWDKQRSKPRI